MRNLRPALLALSALLLIGWFSPEISDTDFWWHLKTGQYLVERHALPVPDPFAWTTASASPAYPGEAQTRQFNLTHEWLSQAALYVIYRFAGFPGIVAGRAFLLTLFCGLAGLIAYHRSRAFYPSLAATFAAAAVAAPFALDRPFLVTFLLLALTLAILEFDRCLWLLPPLFLFWANCHGGFFLGWIALAAWSAEALLRRKPARRLWTVSALSIALSGLNPDGFRVLPVLLSYRGSYLQSRLLEWAPPLLWPPGWFSILLFAAAAILLWQRRKVRPADWMLFIAFAAASLTASRNTVLIGLIAPILIVAYLPAWKRLPYAAGAVILAALASGIARGNFFQFRASTWKWPSGAADFLLAHHIADHLFNTYEHGGYLMWRLWPSERVFIDGRALSDSLFLDYARILYNHDESGGPSAQQLLDRYGVQAIVMNTFEPATGNIYLLAPALADPQQKDWKLVYSDPAALVFLRHPPPDVQPLAPLAVFDHMEAECDLHLAREPQYPRCARSLGQVFLKIGDTARARRWLSTYLRLPHDPDPEAGQALQRLLGPM